MVGVTQQQSLTVTYESTLLSDSAASSLSHMHKAAIVSSDRGARTTRCASFVAFFFFSF